jgi:curved DNA-binding protein CbpA
VIQLPPDVVRAAAAVLGVAVGASVGEVKTATRRLALLHHPDRGGDAGKMGLVLEARSVLLRGRRA